MSAVLFRDRNDAGRMLASRLTRFADRSDVLVLALPRGGVPVGYEVAHQLHVALDLLLVRKLGAPDQEELAMGAIASGGVRVLQPEVLNALQIDTQTLEAITARERAELERRSRLYRGARPEPQISGRTLIVVDDGLATGSTMAAAVAALRSMQPAAIVVAVPVAPPEACRALAREADEVVCAATPPHFVAVGQWYDEFPQVSDDEVRHLLAVSWGESDAPAA